MSDVDQQLKAAFAELQQKMLATRKQLAQSDMQADYHKATIRKSQLTKTQLSAMPDDTEAFLLEPISESIAALSKSIAESEEAIAKAEKSRTYLEASLKSEQNNLREMVQQAQQGKS